MKRKILLLAGAFALLLSSCTMKDNVPPQIYFKVSSPDTAIVGKAYNIPLPPNGVTCDDNFDGQEVQKNLKYTYNIPVGEVAGTTIYPSTTGKYSITYTLTDEAGNQTSKTLDVIVYNEAQKYTTWYRATRSSNEFINSDYNIYDNVFVKLDYDKHKNKRIIFPKLSNINGLVVYGDIFYGDTTLFVDIPMQEVPLIDTTGSTPDTVLFVIRNQTSTSSYFVDTVNYKILLKYDINLYKKSDQANADYISTDETYGRYWKNYKTDNCTETFIKM